MDELNSMRAFVGVVETGSFAATARLMGLSPSVITKRINQLENHLDVDLLRRSTRQLSVTDMGSAYYERCARIVAEVEEAEASVKSMDTGLSGLFRISCTNSFVSSYLSADVCEFQRLHPDLRIDLRGNDYIYDPIAEGYDLCIQARDILNDTITKRPFVDLHRLLVASPAYIGRYGHPSSPEDLLNHRIAINDFVTPDHTLHLSVEDEWQEIQIKPVMMTNSVNLLEAAVEQGECIALIPVFFFAEKLASGSILPVLSDFRLPKAELAAYYRRTPHVPMKIRAFLNFLLEKYGEMPPWLAPLLKKKSELAHHFRDARRRYPVP